MKIAFIGAGHIGKALAHIIGTHHRVALWDAVSAKNPGQESIEHTVTDADIVFLTVPSLSVRQAATHAAPFLTPKTVVVSVSKSLEPGTRMSADQILAETLPPGQPIVFMGGPMLAKEIIEGKAAVAVCGASSRKHLAPIYKSFKHTSLRVEHTRDIHGVALCGILKNCYALLLGVCDGLLLGNNTSGWLMGRSFNEMEKLIPRLHGKKKTLFSAAGIGDFVATATSGSSTNHRAGEEIGRTGKTTIQSEGIIALPTLTAMLGTDIKHFPLLHAISRIVTEHADPRTTLHELLKN